jgi:hypothetical protein
MKSFNRAAALASVCTLASLLAACGGGGGGGGGGYGGGGGSYTVGGTVSGLAGNGLVLLNNSGDALNVKTSSGSFTFATAIANGKTYDVTVQTQPSGQTCTLANASGTMGASMVTNVGVSCAFTASGTNQVAISVNPGPSANFQTPNDLLVTVTVCVPGSQTCVQIPDVLVDTQSWGLRVLKSALGAVVLPTNPDPAINGNSLFECFQFAGGYTWGPVANADIKISGESAAGVPIQVIDDTGAGAMPPWPPSPVTLCTGTGASQNSVNAFDANGVLGIGNFIQDCGSYCATTVGNKIYYSCNTSCPAGATSTTLALANQVSNPVPGFATDNNGVIIQLPAVGSTGAASVNGALVFGIGTQSNNNLGAVTVLTTSATQGYFTTNFNGSNLANSFIDSGSNGLFFTDNAIPICAAPADSFYCPGSSSAISTVNLNATNQGANGNMTNVAFQIGNVVYLNTNYGNNFALNNIGGPAPGFNGLAAASYFDWGMPFFYGRTIYFAIDGKAAGGTNGPYVAY